MSERIEPLHLAKFLVQRENEVIGKDPKPLQANILQHPLVQEVERDIIKEGIENHPLKIWEMTL